MGILSALAGGRGAPELVGATWFNRDELPDAAQRAAAADNPVQLGTHIQQLTVVNFWSYECLECGDLIPTLRSWWQELAASGLFVVGVHTPMYESEGRKENVQSAVLRFGMTYPVLSDPTLVNWKEWDVSARPELFLVTKKGRIKKRLSNKEKVSQFESSIRRLLSA